MSEEVREAKYVARRLLSALLPEVDQFYRTVSCLDPETREILAYIKMYQIISAAPEDIPFDIFLEQVAKPCMIKLGISRWIPDLLSELAIKVSEKPPKVSAEKEIRSLMEEDEE